MTDEPRTPGNADDPYGQQDPYGQAPSGQPPHGQPPHPETSGDDYWQRQAQQGQPYGQAYGQPPHGQPPYAQPPYAQPPYAQQSPYPAPKPPVPSSATTAMILGILALGSVVIACGIGLLAAPFAWVIGGRALREIDASHGALGGRDQAQAGRVMGIIGTILLVLVLLIALAVIALVVIGGSASMDGTTTYNEF